MTLLVYVTEECKKKARQHALSDELERFRDRVEKSQSISQFDPFPPPYLVKKKLGGRQGRLVAELRQEEEFDVVVFLTIMIRGDRAYEDQFGRDPISYGNQYFKQLVKANELEAYVADRTKSEPPPVKQEPSPQEYAFLYEVFSHRQGSAEDDIIFETHEWKAAVAEERISNQLVRFVEPCIKALELSDGIHRVDIPSKPGWAIWVLRSRGRLLLIKPVTKPESVDEKEEINNQYSGCLSSDNDIDHVIRASQRAYPGYMLADEDTWVEIEKEPVANMALSPEESEVLTSARCNDGAFPLFINGRAGSGKSTILQYLFADLLYYYLSKPEAQAMAIAPPIYLTANGELLQAARSFVERILKNEVAFRQDDNSILAEGKEEVLSESFRECRPFLLSLIPPDKRRDHFAARNFIDYSRFRQLWSEWFAQDPEASREYGPDVCWHVIRSYIKGMLSEALMDVDEYGQLPENQVTVSKTTFSTVFDRVWEKRYQPLQEEKGLWDDQDLARYILDNDLVKPRYPAVVCDEAQDFTRIELELLLRLNLFSDRTLLPHDLCRVPFAFAGDQFQTLNPTGFRWEAIKVAFIEKFIDALDPARRSGRTELNYHELRFNYRSTPSIVRFSNGVQALRSAALNMPELRPQTPWAYSKGVFPVVWFEANDVAFWNKYKSLESFVLIVPCNEGEEGRFVSEDPILRKHIRIEDGIPLNVLSAARAKGREYHGVVVYGFGSASPDNLQNILGGLTKGSTQERHSLLPLEYFFSRLYVAVSRPKHRLIIVDSSEAIGGFWDFLSREEKIEEVVAVADRGRDIWTADEEDKTKSAVQGMSMGNVDDLTKENAVDPLENAKAFEEDGRTRRDSFLLRQASQAYRSAGETQKSTECRALALELEGDFLQAARSFCDAGLVIPQGVRSFWKGGEVGWKELLSLGKQNHHVTRETEFKIARISLVESSTPKDSVEVLQEVANRLADTQFAVEVSAHQSWQTGIHNAVSRALKDTSTTALRQLEEVLETIESRGISIDQHAMADIHYRLGSFTKAVQRWERAGETISERYLKAKASSEPYPGKLEALLKIDAYDELIKQFKANHEFPLTKEQWQAVARAFLAESQFEDAFEAAWEAQDPGVLWSYTFKAAEAGNSELAVCGLRAVVMAMVDSGEWDALVKYSSSNQFIPERDWEKSSMKEFVGSQAQSLQCALIAALARSDKFVDLPWHLKRHLTDFLRRFLRVKEGQWRTEVSLQEAGAAIERGGRFADALAFYDAALKDPNFSKSEKEFAHERWLESKRRQLKHEQRHGDPHHRVSDLQREIDQALIQSKIKRLSDLQPLPLLGPVTKPSYQKHLSSNSAILSKVPQGSRNSVKDEVRLASESATSSSSAEVATGELTSEQSKVFEVTGQESSNLSLCDRVEAQTGSLRIELSRGVGRCNLSHITTMKTGYVNLLKREAGGEFEWSQTCDSEWSCDELGIIIRCDNHKLLIEDNRHGLSLSFQHPTTQEP